MKDKNTPAFPVAVPFERINQHNEKVTDFDIKEGMDLRDYFAAKAMQALINQSGGTSSIYGETSIRAYKYADAMLTERNMP